jgi:signal transduction histidine kinase/BarA-like signal transduction histidine kinase
VNGPKEDGRKNFSANAFAAGASFPFPFARLTFEGDNPALLYPNPALLEEGVLPEVKGDSVPFKDFVTKILPEDRERFLTDITLFHEDKETFRGSYRFLAKEGERYEEISCAYDATHHEAALIFVDVDEDKKSDLALQMSWSHYHAAVRATGLLLFEYHIAEKKVVMSEDDVTKEGCERFGLPMEKDQIPESIRKYIDPQDYAVLLAGLSEAEEGGEVAVEIGYHLPGSNLSRCEKITFFPYDAFKGRPSVLFGIGQDVSSERHLEERYQQEMDYLRHNRDESLIAKGHYSLTKNRVLEYENDDQGFNAFAEGQPYDDCVKALVSMAPNEREKGVILHALDRPTLLALYQKGETGLTVEYWRYSSEMKTVWVSLSVHFFLAPDSGDVEAFSYAYDITARKLYESVMSLLSREHFDYIGLIHLRDKTFEFIEKSPDLPYAELRHLFAYDDCVNFVAKDFTNPEEEKRFRDTVALSVIAQGLQETEKFVSTYIYSKKGVFYSKQLNYVWLDEKKQTILAVRSDISQSYRKDQEQMAAINAAKLEAEKASEAKSAFLSSMSHDIRTPLNGVIGFTDIALHEKDPSRLHDELDKIRSSEELLQDLVNDILDMSRIESGKMTLEPQSLALKDAIDEVVTALKPSAEIRHLTITNDDASIAKDLVFADRLKLQKILLNLLSNAIKYTPEGGHILVSAHKKDLPNGFNYELVVKDDGIGMSEEFLQKIYEPFSQEHRFESQGISGTGLGMAIVKGIVTLMGGEILCESAVDQGTAFTVHLPLTPSLEAPLKKTIGEKDAALLKGKRVLLFEDNNINAEIATILLKEKSMSVDWVKNGKEGLEKFSACPVDSYDVILMDIQMPIMGGIEATKEIRALERPDAKMIPIIAMTGNAFQEDVERCLSAGMNAHLAKPIDPERLFETILHYLPLDK